MVGKSRTNRRQGCHSCGVRAALRWVLFAGAAAQLDQVLSGPGPIVRAAFCMSRTVSTRLADDLHRRAEDLVETLEPGCPRHEAKLICQGLGGLLGPGICGSKVLANLR